MSDKNNVEIIDKIFFIRMGLEAQGNGLIFKEFGLTTSLYSILKMMECGAGSLFEMKKWTSESPASLTQKINKLENLELIERELCKKDKRKWNLYFTKKGEREMKKIKKKIEKYSTELFKNFSEKEKESLSKNLDKLMEKILFKKSKK